MLKACFLVWLLQVVILDVTGESHYSRKDRRYLDAFEDELDNIMHAFHEVKELKPQSHWRRGATWNSEEVIDGDNGGWGNGDMDVSNLVDFSDHDDGDEIDDETGVDWSPSNDFEDDENSWVDSIGDEVDDDKFWGV